MAHYAMLNEYKFSADVDDIRGSNLYSADNRKLGEVVDVIFDHDTGAIRYLVADHGHQRKILVAANHVYRSIADEDDFETDISAAEIDRLPRFDENMLKDEEKWREHEREHRRAWKQHEERLLAEYKRKWDEAPVQHRQGSNRNVTPDETLEELPEAELTGAGSERIVTGIDLTPHRIAGKFPGADPMVVPGAPNAGETTLRPVADRDESVFGSTPPSPRWRGFEESLRQNLGEIRLRCTTCCPPSVSRVA